MLHFLYLQKNNNTLSYKFVYSLVKLFYGIKIVMLDGIDNAGRHVLFEDHATD